MAVKELKINFEKTHSKLLIKGRRDVLSRAVEGNWATLFKGKGMEFTGYRAYTYSDDASTIDWRATLRSKETLVREFEEFKNYNILFFLDTSDSMLCTSGDLFKAEYGAEVVFNLSEEAASSGDAIGLGMFNETIKGIIQPAFGKGIRLRFQQSLLDKENYSGKREFKKVMLQLLSLLSDRSIIIIVSDFLGLPKEWSKYISLLSQEHHLIGIMIRDKRDRELPKSGQFSLKDPNTNETLYVDVKQYRKEYAKLAKENENLIRNVFKRVRSDCLILENEDKEYKQKMRKFFNKLSNINM